MSASMSPRTNWEMPAANSATDFRIRVRPAALPFNDRFRHNQLARTVTDEIVPRLLLARRDAQTIARDYAQDVELLVALVLHDNFDIDSAEMVALTRPQLDCDAIYLDLLTPAARRLGAMWEDDQTDFVRVTIGVARLQQILTRHSTPFDQRPELSRRAPRILLAPAPGDQHTFGLAMVTSFFQRAGWNGWSGNPASMAELLGRVRGQSFSVVGFSVADGKHLERLTDAIRAVRRASRNRDVGIMVGGPIFIAHPELVAMVGADTSAVDGRGAVQQARRLLSLKPPRSR